MEKTYLVNTITEWNEPPRARHQVASALAKEHQVVFVEANRIGLPGIKYTQIHDKLRVCTPSFPVPYKLRYRIRLFNVLFQRWFYKTLAKAFPNGLMINFDFTAARLHHYFPDNVYYCNDDHITMSFKNNPAWVARYQESCEKTVIQEANLCVGTSAFLTNRMKLLNAQAKEIRLGAPDLEGYQRSPMKEPVNDRPIEVGLVGYFRTIDSGLIDYLLSKEDIFIKIVGPASESERAPYVQNSRIEFTGSLKGHDLFKAVNGFHVGLIPYNIDSGIDRTPNKLWLYLALGIPVVISNIKGIKDWSFPDRFVYRSNSNEEFYKLVKQSIKEDLADLHEKRALFAEQNSWNHRIEELIPAMRNAGMKTS